MKQSVTTQAIEFPSRRKQHLSRSTTTTYGPPINMTVMIRLSLALATSIPKWGGSRPRLLQRLNEIRIWHCERHSTRRRCEDWRRCCTLLGCFGCGWSSGSLHFLQLQCMLLCKGISFKREISSYGTQFRWSLRASIQQNCWLACWPRTVLLFRLFFFSDPLKLYYGGARIPIALLNMYCRQHSLAVYGMRLYCRMLPDGIIWHARWLFAAGEMSHSLMVCLYGISTSERLIIWLDCLLEIPILYLVPGTGLQLCFHVLMLSSIFAFWNHGWCSDAKSINIPFNYVGTPLTIWKSTNRLNHYFHKTQEVSTAYLSRVSNLSSL